MTLISSSSKRSSAFWLVASLLVSPSALAQEGEAPGGVPDDDSEVVDDAVNDAELAPGVGQPAMAPAETRAEAAVSTESEVLRRFAGSQLFTQVAANLNTFFPDLQQTPNETVGMAVVLAPRFDLGEGFQLRARAGFDLEFTDSDWTKYQNEVMWRDTSVQLFYRGLPAMPWGTRAQFAVQASLPTSKVSQAQTNIVTPGALGQVFHTFTDVLDGAVTVIATANYSHPIFESGSPQLRYDYDYARSCGAGAAACTTSIGGANNVSDRFSWSALLVGGWGDFAPGVFFGMGHDFPIEAETGGTAADPGVEEFAGVRNTMSFAAWLDWNATSWLTAEIGYSMSRGLLDGDGTYGNPIFDRDENMQVYALFNVGLDRFYKALAGDESEAQGVIRN